MSKLTPAQSRVSTHWPRHTFHASKVTSYRDSRVMFNAARALGLSASYSGNLFVTWPEAETHVDRVIAASMERILRRLDRWNRPSEEEIGELREFVKNWCPMALPAFDLIRFRMYV